MGQFEIRSGKNEQAMRELDRFFAESKLKALETFYLASEVDASEALRIF